MTERIIQFGEGGFLRGFVDWMLQIVNEETDYEGSVVVVQPIEKGMCDILEAQNCEYTHIIRGVEGVLEKKINVISRCVKPYEDWNAYLALAENPDFRFVVSNTTESGIVYKEDDKATDMPPASFPAKVTLLLKRRYDLNLGGFVFLPCELIDKNGKNLRECVIKCARNWGFDEEFISWVENENVFCNTLVDRINTGYPKDENIESDDKMLNTSEYFHLWVVEGYDKLFDEIPFDKANLNVIVTNELEKYRTRKVRILNGAHTSMIPYALLSGLETVKDCLEDEKMSAFLRRCVFEEIMPTLDLPKEELEAYASSVMERFANPYIKHYCSSIALNSVSKFKVRVLPSLEEYIVRFGKMTENLLFSFAQLIKFYRTDMTNDAADVTAFMKTATVEEILANETLWDKDLSYLVEEVKKYVD